LALLDKIPTIECGGMHLVEEKRPYMGGGAGAEAGGVVARASFWEGQGARRNAGRVKGGEEDGWEKRVWRGFEMVKDLKQQFMGGLISKDQYNSEVPDCLREFRID
jgi:hypothetical protein